MADHDQSSDGKTVTRPMLPIRPVMTQLRFEYNVAEFGAPIALLHKGKEREIIETTAGQALSATLTAIARELGYVWAEWAEPVEETNSLLIFIGWEGNPSPALASTAAYQRIEPASALSAFTPHLRSPPEVVNMPLHEIIGVPIVNPSSGSASLEMVTWTFPPNLDPKSHVEHAATFREVDEHIRMVTSRSSLEPPGRLLTIRQAWVAQDPEVMLNDMEHSERTHVYLFVWKSRGAELAVKIDEPLIKKAGGYPGYSWEDTFVAAEDDWKKRGMISTSLHLVTHSFP